MTAVAGEDTPRAVATRAEAEAAATVEVAVAMPVAAAVGAATTAGLETGEIANMLH